MRSKSEIEQDLADVRTAISNIIKGEVSSVNFKDRSLNTLDLQGLRRRESELIHELNKARGIRRWSKAKLA